MGPLTSVIAGAAVGTVVLRRPALADRPQAAVVTINTGHSARR